MRKLGKRGMGELIEWVWPMAMMIIAIIVIGLLVRYYSGRHVESQELDATAYTARILYDGAVITYVDPQTGRAYPGIVDAQKFTTKHLDEIFSERPDDGPNSVSQIAAQIALTGGEGCGPAERTIYNDKATYDEKIGFAQNNVQGPGGASLFVEKRPITIRDGAQLCPAQMTITMVRPNS